MEILCPKCRKKYLVPDSAAGKQAQCKDESCGQVFTVPRRRPAWPRRRALRNRLRRPAAGHVESTG